MQSGLGGGRPTRRRSSRRRKRRQLLAAVAVVVAAAVGVAVWIGNTGQEQLPLTDRPTIVEPPTRPAPLSAADRRAIVFISRQFIKTAVRRDHPERAWALVTDALRRGTTKEDWKAGTLPFPPYPVRSARWAFAYSNVGEVGLDVLLQSSDTRIRPLVHRITLVRATRTAGPSWLVDGWVAMAATPGGFGSVVTDPAQALENAAAPRTTPDPGTFWVLAPFVVLLVALLIPLAILIGNHRAEQRVLRRHRASAQHRR